MVRKICVVTATRAEFGPLKCLIEGIASEANLELQLVVTGTHLSPEFGYTISQIIESGLKITKTVEILLSSDSAIGVSKSMGLALISFAEVYEDLKPDMVLVLGDRYELLPIVSAANISRIPVVHISGGEITEGAIDDNIRHSITKMSSLHFTALEEYRKRVIQMGEQPSTVFNVGEPGLENFHKMQLLTKSEFEKAISYKLSAKNLLITYHPETIKSIDNIKIDFSVILKSLDDLTDTLFIFTKANADVGGRIINDMIDEYVSNNVEKAIVFNSLGQLRYLSALKHVDAVVGNSSSGICEAPSFMVATINIGSRQKGRVRAESIIDVEANKESLSEVFAYIYTPKFKSVLKQVINPYGNKHTSSIIINILKSINIQSLKYKSFFDIDY